MRILSVKAAIGKKTACSIADTPSGHEVTEELSEKLSRRGYSFIPVVDSVELGEVEACSILGEAMAGEGVSVEVSAEGRAVFVAGRRGLYTVDENAVKTVIENGLFMFASVRQPAHVEQGSVLAVLEAVQPGYTREEVLGLAAMAKGSVRVARYKRLRLGLVVVKKPSYDQTTIEEIEKAVLEKLGYYGQQLCRIERVRNEKEKIRYALDNAIASCDGVIIAGSVGSKKDDLVPEVVSCGYRVRLLALPVKPTVNSCLAFGAGEKPVICVPSRIARFREENSLDLLLPVVASGVDPHVLLWAWNGGLKKQWINRYLPKD